MHYFLSFSIGMMMVTVAFAVCYLWYCIGTGKQFPELHWREATLPGTSANLIRIVSGLYSLRHASPLRSSWFLTCHAAGLLSGTIWNVGNLARFVEPDLLDSWELHANTILTRRSIFATSYLGLTIGFPLTQVRRSIHKARIIQWHS